MQARPRRAECEACGMRAKRAKCRGILHTHGLPLVTRSVVGSERKEGTVPGGQVSWRAKCRISRQKKDKSESVRNANPSVCEMHWNSVAFCCWLASPSSPLGARDSPLACVLVSRRRTKCSISRKKTKSESVRNARNAKPNSASSRADMFVFSEQICES